MFVRERERERDRQRKADRKKKNGMVLFVLCLIDFISAFKIQMQGYTFLHKYYIHSKSCLIILYNNHNTKHSNKYNGYLYIFSFN